MMLYDDGLRARRSAVPSAPPAQEWANVHAPSAPPLPPAYTPFDEHQPRDATLDQHDPLRSRVRLRVSCSNLLNRDITSKSDPCVYLFIQNHNNSWELFGNSEVVSDDLNPVFQTTFEVQYLFEAAQRLAFIVVDVDNDAPMVHQDYLGFFSCTLARIVSSGLEGTKAPLSREFPPFVSFVNATALPVNKGIIHIFADLESELRTVVKLGVSCQDLPTWGLFYGSNNPYITIERGSSRHAVFKSSVVKGTSSPTWPVLKIPLRRFGGVEERIRVSVWTWNSFRKDRLIGSVETTVAEMQTCGRLALSSGNTFRGFVVFNSCHVTDEMRFIDYVGAGARFRLCVAIDFTASNGDPNKPDSLHHFHRGGAFDYMNPYQKAISSVTPILAEYDSEGAILVKGYGFRLFDSVISDALLGVCDGVDAVMRIYEETLGSAGFKLWGPTNFAPVINNFAGEIRQSMRSSPENAIYHILLIITDGEISDMSQTIEAIVDAASLPLSIVIVGVGSADFSSMKILDGDEERLSANGRKAVRDIVQFVPLNSQGTSFSLARETLAEIPSQFMQWKNGSESEPSDVRHDEITSTPIFDFREITFYVLAVIALAFALGKLFNLI